MKFKALTISMLPFNQKGYLIIENLVAISIIAVGMLGVSVMQLTALKSGQGATERGKVALIISNMTERMRSNTPAVITGDYAFAQANVPPTLISNPTTPADVANNDQILWFNELNTALSFGAAPKMQIICTTPRSCTLAVDWSLRHSYTQTELEYEAQSSNSSNQIQRFETTVIF